MHCIALHMHCICIAMHCILCIVILLISHTSISFSFNFMSKFCWKIFFKSLFNQGRVWCLDPYPPSCLTTRKLLISPIIPPHWGRAWDLRIYTALLYTIQRNLSTPPCHLSCLRVMRPGSGESGRCTLLLAGGWWPSTVVEVEEWRTGQS